MTATTTIRVENIYYSVSEMGETLAREFLKDFEKDEHYEICAMMRDEIKGGLQLKA